MLFWEREIWVEIGEFGANMGFKGSGHEKISLG